MIVKNLYFYFCSFIFFTLKCLVGDKRKVITENNLNFFDCKFYIDQRKLHN